MLFKEGAMLARETDASDALTREDIVSIAEEGLRASGRSDVAERLTRLVVLLEEEEEDWTVEKGSVLTFVSMFAECADLPTPAISISHAGKVQAEWRVGSRGLMVMGFQEDGRVHFIANSAPATVPDRRRLTGILPYGEVMPQILPALEWP